MLELLNTEEEFKGYCFNSFFTFAISYSMYVLYDACSVFKVLIVSLSFV
jgi:hypothetical protein